MNHIIAVLALLLSISSLNASIRWDKTVFLAQMNPGQQQVTGKFTGVNTGSEIVEIEDIHTSCDCTHATANTKIIKPNQSIEINVIFDVEDRKGSQRKRIVIKSNNTKDTLFFQVNIPELLTIIPRFVYWQSKDNPSPKEMIIKINPKLSIEIAKVESSSDSFSTELIANTEKEGEYVLKVTPLNLKEKPKSVITVTTDYPKEKPMTYTVHAHVK